MECQSYWSLSTSFSLYTFYISHFFYFSTSHFILLLLSDPNWTSVLFAILVRIALNCIKWQWLHQIRVYLWSLWIWWVYKVVLCPWYQRCPSQLHFSFQTILIIELSYSWFPNAAVPIGTLSTFQERQRARELEKSPKEHVSWIFVLLKYRHLCTTDWPRLTYMATLFEGAQTKLGFSLAKDELLE